jgi:hypothetical protein
VVEALLRKLERHRHVEDRLAVLTRDHPAGAEGPAVAGALHVVHDRDRRVAGAQEVGVQRVDLAVPLDGAHPGDERLAGNLPPKHTLERRVGLASAEEPGLDLFEVEQGEELVCRLGHLLMLAAESHGPSPGRRLAWAR